MNRTHSLILAALVIAASFGAVAAQGGRQRIPAPRDSQFYEPRNKLEEFESRLGTILIKGRTYVGTLQVREGSARVEATEIRDAGNSTRATGVVITFTTVESGGSPGEVRSLIDYEDIDPLIKAFDTAAKADESITKLTHFEARYRTRGDLDIVVFKKISGGVAAVVEGGFFERKRLTLTLDEFTKLRWFIAQAKDRLDEIPVP
jgi:hypothetical protein